MRLPLVLCALLAFTAAACDSAGDDPAPYAGIIEVSLARTADEGTGLRLVAVDDTGCQNPLAVETEATPSSLRVRVVGIVQPAGPSCHATIPASAVVPLPFTQQGEFPVEVVHRGATDLYAYSIGFAGETLQAVRTSTTRLATP